MKKFEEPMFKIVEFKSADVITTSVVEMFEDHDNARKSANDIAQIGQNFWL